MGDFRKKTSRFGRAFRDVKSGIQGPVHTYPFCLKTKDFFSRLAYCLHVSGENCHQRRIFPKTRSRFVKMPAYCFRVDLACERALRGALAARRGREKEGELATTSLELI